MPLPWCASMSTTATGPPMPLSSASGGDRRVVEVARAAVERAGDVVPGRAAACVRERLAVGDEVDGGQRDVDRGTRRLPRSRPDQRHRVVGEEARPRPHCCGRGGRAPARQRRAGEDVGDDAVGGEAGAPTTRPRPCAGTRRAPDRAPRAAPSRRAQWLRPRVHPLRERVADRDSPRRQLRRRRAHPDPDLRLRLVAQAVVAPDERQQH